MELTALCHRRQLCLPLGLQLVLRALVYECAHQAERPHSACARYGAAARSQQRVAEVARAELRLRAARLAAGPALGRAAPRCGAALCRVRSGWAGGAVGLAGIARLQGGSSAGQVGCGMGVVVAA